VQRQWLQNDCVSGVTWQSHGIVPVYRLPIGFLDLVRNIAGDYQASVRHALQTTLAQESGCNAIAMFKIDLARLPRQNQWFIGEY